MVWDSNSSRITGRASLLRGTYRNLQFSGFEGDFWGNMEAECLCECAVWGRGRRWWRWWCWRPMWCPCHAEGGVISRECVSVSRLSDRRAGQELLYRPPNQCRGTPNESQRTGERLHICLILHKSESLGFMHSSYSEDRRVKSPRLRQQYKT